MNLFTTIETVKKTLIARALVENAFNQSKTAPAIGMSRRNLMLLMKKFNIRTQAQITEAAGAKLEGL